MIRKKNFSWKILSLHTCFSISAQNSPMDHTRRILAHCTNIVHKHIAQTLVRMLLCVHIKIITIPSVCVGVWVAFLIDSFARAISIQPVQTTLFDFQLSRGFWCVQHAHGPLSLSTLSEKDRQSIHYPNIQVN